LRGGFLGTWRPGGGKLAFKSRLDRNIEASDTGAYDRLRPNLRGPVRVKLYSSYVSE